MSSTHFSFLVFTVLKFISLGENFSYIIFHLLVQVKTSIIYYIPFISLGENFSYIILHLLVQVKTSHILYYIYQFKLLIYNIIYQFRGKILIYYIIFISLGENFSYIINFFYFLLQETLQSLFVFKGIIYLFKNTQEILKFGPPVQTNISAKRCPVKAQNDRQFLSRKLQSC